ncbi:MAG: B12-binding domain-containing radical SAM protein, partial [Lachnospiraceae bacterium]|nr:B12-binding domain-containing radical SAM protein [Lachnospiraceae bacterium]
MRKTALPEDILLSVEKAARYIGNEFGAIMKDAGDVKIRYAICFPDVYEIGMSHLGIQILYDMFNRRSDVWCERVYSPWTDAASAMKREGIPLFALESQDRVRDFDFIGMTLQYEMCYTNILQILDLAGVPLLAKERGEDMPIVIGGGPCTYNPEPLCDFFDIFFIGEGEAHYDEFFDLYINMKEDAFFSKEAFLREAARIPGFYVPSFYEVGYNEDGTIASFLPKEEGVPATVKRQVITDLDAA